MHYPWSGGYEFNKQDLGRLNNMSKDALGGVQEQVQQEIEKAVVGVAQNVLKEVEKEVLNPDQAKKVQDAFNQAVEGFEGQAVDSVEKAKEQIGGKLDKGLDAIGILPEETRANLKKAGHEVIDKVSNAALDVIKQTAIDAKDLMVTCVKSITNAITNVFSAIGQVVTKEKTVEQAREGIVEGFKTAGQEISTAAKGFANSFVERLGLSSKKDKEMSHVEKVTAEKTAPVQEKAR